MGVDTFTAIAAEDGYILVEKVLVEAIIMNVNKQGTIKLSETRGVGANFERDEGFEKARFREISAA